MVYVTGVEQTGLFAFHTAPGIRQDNN